MARYRTMLRWLAVSMAVSACMDATSGGTDGGESSSSVTDSGSMSSSGPEDSTSTGGDDDVPWPDANLCRSDARTPSHPAIVFDVELHCTDFDLGGDGVSIVNDDARAFVSTSHGRTSVLFSVDEDGATALPWASGRFVPGVHLAVSASGELLIPARSSTVEGPSRFELWTYDVQETNRFLFEAGDFPDVVGFDVEGERFDLWLRSSAGLERRSSEQGFSAQILEPHFAASLFGLDANGDPFAAGLVATADGASIVLDAQTLSEAAGPTLWLAHDAPALPEDAARVVLMTDPNALWLHRPGTSDVVLPGTEPAPRSCDNLQCDEPCFEDGIGRLGRAASIARTGDGQIWASYVYVELALGLTLESPQACGSVGSCECQPAVTSDESRLEVRLLGIGADGSVTQTSDLVELDVPLRSADDSPRFEMSASEDRITLVTRAGADGLRVLMIDPAGLE